jgi:hypothetical protein
MIQHNTTNCTRAERELFRLHQRSVREEPECPQLLRIPWIPLQSSTSRSQPLKLSFLSLLRASLKGLLGRGKILHGNRERMSAQERYRIAGHGC